MENREQVLSDYFRPRLMLNRTNMIRDEKTDLDFIVVKEGSSTYRLMATLIGLRDPKSMELCCKEGQALWRSTGYSGLPELEDFCVKFFRKNLGIYFSGEELKKTAAHLKNRTSKLRHFQTIAYHC